MADLIYSCLTSLDGYVADQHGSFGWARPDEEVHGFVNDLQRPVGTHLYGRRLYEVMRAWETMPTSDDSPVEQDFARLWRGAAKIVYSRTLTEVPTARTRLVPEFDPDDVARLKATGSSDLLVGGPGLAEQALRAGLVDEIHQFLFPVVVGGGTAFFPAGLNLSLELLDEHRFGSGVVYLRHRVHPTFQPRRGG